MDGQPQTFFVNPGEPVTIVFDVSAEQAGERLAVTVTPRLKQKRPERRRPLRRRVSGELRDED